MSYTNELHNLSTKDSDSILVSLINIKIKYTFWLNSVRLKQRRDN
jgi:hypothetical protein